MAVKTLTLDEARKNSAMFLYIFADNTYLSYIPKKYANIISNKRANQRKLLVLSAQAYINQDAVYGGAEYMQYVNAVKDGFQATYGMSPQDALVKLALGENVAGKNWSEGVYGVGAVDSATFYGTTITVNPETGHIYNEGVDCTDTTLNINKDFGGKIGTIPFQLFATIGDVTYMSEYKRGKKQYFAKSYSNASGKYSAADGKAIESVDAATVFENIQLGTWDFLEFLQQILNFLGININLGGGNSSSSSSSSSSSQKEQINEENTLPNQQKDGYSQDEPNTLNASAIMAAVAAGALIIGKLMPNRRGKKRK